jgi:hypothetical protein
MLLGQLFLSRNVKRTATLLISKDHDDPAMFWWFFQFVTFYRICFVQIKTLRASNGSKYYVCSKMLVAKVMSLPLFYSNTFKCTTTLLKYKHVQTPCMSVFSVLTLKTMIFCQPQNCSIMPTWFGCSFCSTCSIAATLLLSKLTASCRMLSATPSAQDILNHMEEKIPSMPWSGHSFHS